MTHIQKGTNCRISPVWPCLQPSAVGPECHNSEEGETWELLYPPWRLGIGIGQEGRDKANIE